MLLQSSAVGVACAGELYFSASFSVALLLSLLRFGPRQHEVDEHDGTTDENNLGYSAAGLSTGGAPLSTEEQVVDPELQPLRHPDMKLTSSVRQRASLGGIL